MAELLRFVSTGEHRDQLPFDHNDGDRWTCFLKKSVPFSLLSSLFKADLPSNTDENMAILKIHGRSVYDSRGNPTVEVDVVTGTGLHRAIVPSGASTGLCKGVSVECNGLTENQFRPA